MFDAWQVGPDEPKIDKDGKINIKDVPLGTQKVPLDLSNCGDINLHDIDTIIKLIDPEQEKDVPNLTKAQVKAMDKVVNVLRLDKYRWIYFRNSRKDDETNSTFE